MWLCGMQAVLKALREREVALLTVHSLQRDMAVKQRARQALMDDGQKVFGGDKGKERKAQGLQNDMATLEQSTSAAEHEYDKVMDRNHQVCSWPPFIDHTPSSLACGAQTTDDGLGPPPPRPPPPCCAQGCLCYAQTT